MILIVLLLLMLIIQTAVFAPALARKEDSLNYRDFSSIYDGELFDLKYNKNYPNGEANSIVEKILAQYDSSLSDDVQDDEVWNEANIQNYTEFLTGIADTGLGASEKETGAYWVNAEQDEDSLDWDIDAVVYMRASSPAAAPVYGNLML